MNETLLVVIVVLACLLLVPLVHLAVGGTPFLLCPPFAVIKCRIRCVMTRSYVETDEETGRDYVYVVPWRDRLQCGVGLLIRLLVVVPLSELCMAVDEVMFGYFYRRSSLDGAVLLVGAFRTGSTSLHRLLSDDDGRFVSPRLAEMLFPFVWAHAAWDATRLVLGRDRADRWADAAWRAALGDEVLRRHPMNVNEPDEDDLLLSLHRSVGWYAGTTFPHPSAWTTSGRHDRASPRDRERTLEFYERTLRKIAWRRGGDGRVLLCKSHLVPLLPDLRRRIPDLRVAGLVRHPANSFESWYGLGQATKGRLVDPDFAVRTHLAFWDDFTRDEMTFFRALRENGENGHRVEPTSGMETTDEDTTDSELELVEEGDGGSRRGSCARPKTKVGVNGDDNNSDKRCRGVVVRFADFVSDHVGTVEGLYERWGFGDVRGTPFHDRLVAGSDDFKSYRKKKTYRDATLEELGLDDALVSQRYATYVDFFGLKAQARTKSKSETNTTTENKTVATTTVTTTNEAESLQDGDVDPQRGRRGLRFVSLFPSRIPERDDRFPTTRNDDARHDASATPTTAAES